MPIEDRTDSLIRVAKLLGINPITEPQYLWIAQQACKATVEPEWQEFTNDKDVIMYYNSRTKTVHKTHPVIEKYSQLLSKQKSFTNSLQLPASLLFEDTPEELLELIRSVNERVARGMTPTTPAIILKLSSMLNIDPHSEIQLVRCVKKTFELYVEKRFDLKSFVSDLHTPVQLLRKAFKAQIKEDIAFKPTSVTLCDECEKRSAVFKCLSCEDYFCQSCYTSLHATGNRRNHTTEEVDQLVCVICDYAIAACQCVQCGSFFCLTCYDTFHSSRPELNNHLKRIINGLVCLECEHFNATVLCEDCVDMFCTDCFNKLHSKGRRRLHTQLTIDEDGQILKGGVSVEGAEELVARTWKLQVAPFIEFEDDGGQKFVFDF